MLQFDRNNGHELQQFESKTEEILMAFNLNSLPWRFASFWL